MDLIERQEAIEALVRDCKGSDEGMLNMYDIICDLKELPSAQPEIIRCRECRYHYGSDCDNFAGVWVNDDDFCSRAERREVSG